MQLEPVVQPTTGGPLRALAGDAASASEPAATATAAQACTARRLGRATLRALATRTDSHGLHCSHGLHWAASG